MRHPGDDDLALLALGEHQPAVHEHVQGCPRCAAELLALRATVRTVRDAELGAPPAPPPSVWERVSGELGLRDGPATLPPSAAPGAGATPGAWAGAGTGAAAHPGSVPAAAAAPARAPVSPGSTVVGRRRPRLGRRLALAALAVAASAAAVGVVVVRDDGPGQPSSQLTALGGVDGRGEAVLAAGRDGRVLEVATQGLPSPDGFYEVWLLDPDTARILALGTLDEAGRARLSVPDGVDLADYTVVDVSAEPDDGDPAHSSDSVLRGALPA